MKEVFCISRQHALHLLSFPREIITQYWQEKNNTWVDLLKKATHYSQYSEAQAAIAKLEQGFYQIQKIFVVE